MKMYAHGLIIETLIKRLIKGFIHLEWWQASKKEGECNGEKV